MREDIYYPDYMETHDIDWFCRIGAISIHCASNGGVLPKKVNVRSVNRKIQETVAAMPEVLDEHEEVIVNERYVREIRKPFLRRSLRTIYQFIRCNGKKRLLVV